MVIERIKSLFKQAEPAGPPESIRGYTVSDYPLTQDAVNVDEDAWRIQFDEARVIPLFEMEQPDVEQCILTYRARMRTENAQGRVYLEMWCRFPGKGEFFSRGLQQAVMGHHRLVNTRDPVLPQAWPAARLDQAEHRCSGAGHRVDQGA